MLFFFPLIVLDEIWDVIESVSEGFRTYYHSHNTTKQEQTSKSSENTQHLFYLFSIFIIKHDREQSGQLVDK